MEVNGRQILVEAGVSETLPVSCSTDNPVLQVDQSGAIKDALAVTTRAQARKRTEETRKKLVGV